MGSELLQKAKWGPTGNKQEADVHSVLKEPPGLPDKE